MSSKNRKVERSGAPNETRNNRKQTIKSLFSTRQQKTSLGPTDGSLSSVDASPSKRIKLSDGRDRIGKEAQARRPPSPDSPSSPSFTPLSVDKMHNFSGPKSASRMSSAAVTAPKDNCIDLTGVASDDDFPANSVHSTASAVLKPTKPKFNPHAGSRKIEVKNLRIGSNSDPRKYFERVWSQLYAALGTIFSGGRVASLEELYRGVQHVCRQGFAAELAEKVERELTGYIRDRLSKELVPNAVDGKEDMEALKEVLTAWNDWRDHMRTVQWIFIYLDRSYLLHSPKPCLDELGVSLFRDYIFKAPGLSLKVIDGACTLVDVDRKDGEPDMETLRNAIDCFHELVVYTEHFEPRLLEFSQNFMLTWSERAVQEKSLRDYVAASFDLIERERQRCVAFNLDSSTRRALMTLTEHYLIEQQVSFLVSEKGVGLLLSGNAVNDLGALYSLLESRHFAAKLQPAFKKWIFTTGSTIVFDNERAQDMVVRLLVLKRQLDQICVVSFKKHTELSHCLRETFAEFINQSKKTSATWGTDNSKPEEMIAKYVDMLMRGGTKAIPNSLATITKGINEEIDDNEERTAVDKDEEVQQQLDQVLDLFRFVHGKAVFEAFYKRDLARRLLMNRSASDDAERSMLARLKTECGAGFTQNLETMFKDIDLAREEMLSYRAFLEGRGKKQPFDFSVQILTFSAWPYYPDIPAIIPSDIRAVQDRFEKYYKSKHGGRKLQWKPSLAHCQLKAAFPKARKEIVVSSFQALVLLLFNDIGPDDTLSYENIRDLTGLPEDSAKLTLQSLACAKLRPLTKKPKGREINPGDIFFLNQSFSDERFRVKINQIQMKETKEENKETHVRVAMDRNYETQAAIVRIMKSRKTIPHAELVGEVIKATNNRGVLNLPDIKKNIDSLIEKDYMERVEGTNSYNYIS